VGIGTIPTGFASIQVGIRAITNHFVVSQMGFVSVQIRPISMRMAAAQPFLKFFSTTLIILYPC
jgi:hypothetical protein